MKKLLLLSLFAWSIGTSAQTYCTPAYASGCDSGDNIETFTIPSASFVHANTGCSTAAYGDFTAQTINLSAGLSYQFSITHGYSTQKVRIWIDFNNDGVFTDAAPELVATGSSANVNSVSTTNATISIPVTTQVGNYRMRVGNRYSSEPIPCNTAGYGETHDYTVNIAPAPSCLAPTAVTASSITANSAQISWTASTSTVGVGYEYYYNTNNTIPTSTTTPSGSTNSTTLTATLSGLLSDTMYYVWVRSKCSTSSTSAWSNTGSFRTLCVASAVPYTQNFDTTPTGSYSNNNAPSCWTFLKTAGSTAVGYVSTISPVTAPNSYYISNDADTTGNVMLVSPQTTALSDGTKRVRFYARSGTAGTTLQVGTVADNADAASFTNISTITLTTTNTQYIVNIPVGSNSFAAFKHGLGSTYTSITLDDISVEAIPACVEPTYPSVTGTTTTTATLTWTGPTTAPANGYQIYYSTTNTAPTSSTVLNSTNSTTATTTTGQITGLTPGTVYYAWVRSACSASSTSPWTPSVTFTTQCVPGTVPYTLNFENATVPALPVCTAVINSGAGNLWKTTSGITGYTGNVLVYNYNLAEPANTWFFTRELNLVAGTTYTISFKYGNNSTTYVEKMKVAYGTSATAAGMTNILADYNSITGNTPANANISFTPTTTGVYYFGFNAYSDADQFDLYVDDISIVQGILATAETGITKNTVSVYPNPFSDVLYISDMKNVNSIAVMDVAGRTVKSFGKPTQALQLSELSAGVYLVVLEMNDGTRKTIKTIKK